MKPGETEIPGTAIILGAVLILLFCTYLLNR